MNALEIDLETYVIDYQEVKSVLSLILSLACLDRCPTDLAIKATLFKIAAKENIKYIFSGDF